MNLKSVPRVLVSFLQILKFDSFNKSSFLAQLFLNTLTGLFQSTDSLFELFRDMPRFADFLLINSL